MEGSITSKFHRAAFANKFELFTVQFHALFYSYEFPQLKIDRKTVRAFVFRILLPDYFSILLINYPHSLFNIVAVPSVAVDIE